MGRANAVNGVINIITKNANQTTGTLLEAASGKEMSGAGGARRGGTIGDRTYYRIYSDYHYQNSLGLEGDGSAHDPVRFGQLGFRTDWESYSQQDSITFQGDAYHELGGQTIFPVSQLSGGNVLGRWSRSLAGEANVQLQFYYDGTRRDSPGLIKEDRDTFDLQFATGSAAVRWAMIRGIAT